MEIQIRKINSGQLKSAGRQRGSNRDVGSEVVLGGEKFEVVEEFVYLGTLVTCDNDVTREVKRRLAAANRAFYGLRNQLKSRSLQTKTKFALYKTFILPVALYGHESWTLKEVDRKAFGVFERKVLRTIHGGKQENGIWRRRMNHELYHIYKEVDIIKLIKHFRLRWAGHMVRMPEGRQAKIIFSREPGRGRRLRSRPRTRWLFAVEEDLRTLNVQGDWKRLAQDRAQWRRIIHLA